MDMEENTRCGGFHQWGYPKMLGKIRIKYPSNLEMDDDWGYPYDSGNLHVFKHTTVPAID